MKGLLFKTSFTLRQVKWRVFRHEYCEVKYISNADVNADKSDYSTVMFMSITDQLGNLAMPSFKPAL